MTSVYHLKEKKCVKVQFMKSIVISYFLIFVLKDGIAQKIDIYSRPVQVERSRDFDAIHYKIMLDVNMVNKTITGENQITLSPLNDNFDRLSIDAMYLIVDYVTDRDGKALPFEQKDGQVLVNLTKTYRHTDTLQINVRYTLHKQTEGLKFIDSTASNPLMVSSDCFPDKARQWIPCYDYPNDKATTEMIVSVDKKYKVLSNGKLISINEQHSAGKLTYHWFQQLPIATYLINLSIADYAVIKDSLHALPVNYWVYKGLEADAKTTFRKTPAIIRYFNELYRYPYPWAKYDQVITSYMGGGAEAVSATLLGDKTVMDTVAEKDYSMEGVIAHEIAHQWWGDLITLRSWDHTWLNESFATYSEYLFTKSEHGDDEGALNLYRKKNQYLNEARNRYKRPIVFNRYNDPNDNFDSHTYPKGACMLHLLKYLLGDDAFFRTLNTFLRDNEFRPVDTRDFMKTVKEVSGKNMDWFFDQYIFSAGHPVFEVTQKWNEAGKKLTVTVLQTHEVDAGVPIYHLPVNFGFYFNDNKIVKEVWLKNKQETFDFEFPSRPLFVRFDDGNWILKEVTFKKEISEVKYQAEMGDMTGRLEAVNEMANFVSDTSTFSTWKKRATADSFWAVRQAAVENAGKYYPDKSVELLKTCSRDKNSKVRRSAIRLLGDLKNPAMVKFFEIIFKSEDSYAVRAETLLAIGKAGGKKQLRFLQSAQKMKSYRNVISNAAVEAITMIEKKKTSDIRFGK
jgi:aminopeptidase N